MAVPGSGGSLAGGYAARRPAAPGGCATTGKWSARRPLTWHLVIDSRANRGFLTTLLVAMLAAAVLAAAVAAGARADDGDGFADIAGADVHAPAIEILDALGSLDGTECASGRFCPSEPLPRWVMAVWLVRVLDGTDPEPGGSGDFVDVGAGAWWAGHVDRLAELGITRGCATGPTRYCPSKAVTRGQMATFLKRAFGIEATRPGGFTDIAGNVHAGSIDALVAAEITAGCATDPARYCPSEAVTRGQMATFLARALGLVPSAAFADDVERHGIGHLVSSYTTYHKCCASRVTNIQLFADKIDGAIVPPGGRFSLNRHVGKRTAAEGFLPAGTLVKGELVNTVGGGVSQFATTFYNAMFWGGYRDVAHKPHSFYFSRYPEGIEATINWPDVDLVFRNDTPGYVLLGTEYTDTSITVKFYGDNDGRIVVGDWKAGKGSLEVISEGGSEARVVTAEVSDRFNWVDAPRPLTRENPDLAYDEEKRVQSALTGWTVRVTRTIDRGGRKTIQKWTVWYVPRREINEVHPCVLSDTCPEEEPPGTDGPPPGGSEGHL